MRSYWPCCQASKKVVATSSGLGGTGVAVGAGRATGGGCTESQPTARTSSTHSRPRSRDDAWWEAGGTRGQFKDLPRWTPEVWAAWSSGYNSSRDGTGRFVTFPAMIDLADGLYADLGMTKADWVDVTLTWLDAPS